MIFAHIKAPGYNNIGDAMCCPQQYFDEFKDCRVLSLPELIREPGFEPVVIGGGGIFCYDFDEHLMAITKQRPVIIWGAGLNYPLGPLPDGLLAALRQCALVGMRDWRFVRTNDFVYVPCVSSMHYIFLTARQIKPQFPAVFYKHFSTPEVPKMGIPTVDNRGTAKDFPDVLAFLASGSIVVTDSYHGAYWAQLLGRAVILWQPNAMRFVSGFPFPLPSAHSIDELKTMLALMPRRAPIMPRCTALNREFASLVGAKYL